MGTEIAKVLQPLCKSVTGINRSGSGNGEFDHIYRLSEMPAFERDATIINTLPSTSGTQRFFNEKQFKAFENVLFINVGRGTSVDCKALMHALDNDNLRAAVLDVFEQEPLPDQNPLWIHPKVVVTPHHASKTSEQDLITSFDDIMRLMTNKKKDSRYFVDLSKGY